MLHPENLLVVFFGMIATGKSYLASAWASHYGLPYYNSDRVRKELAGISPETEQKEALEKGIYTPEFSRRTYDKLISLADQHFTKDGRACVVLDGSYQSANERELLRSRFLGQVGLVFVYCFCTDEVVRKRLQIRASDQYAVSDGNWELYCAQKKKFQPVKQLEQVVSLDTDAPVAELVRKVSKAIEEKDS